MKAKISQGGGSISVTIEAEDIKAALMLFEMDAGDVNSAVNRLCVEFCSVIKPVFKDLLDRRLDSAISGKPNA